MKIKGYKHLTGKIELITGLHIGGSKESTEIGGLDSPVIRLPKDDMPYIPGSSLKGKLRSLLELKLGKVEKDGKPHSYKPNECDFCPICRIFGAGAADEAKIGPGRLIVRDALVDEENETVKELKRQTIGLPLSEEKAETAIDRIKGAALSGSLRKTERVPAGVVFNLDITYRVFDIGGDDGKKDEELFGYVLEGLKLIEKDALGGSGSRGYGKVKFTDLKVDGEPIELEGE
ncbi:MAG: type III-A CRISPR-associated RAMP protein Csm3 [Armatimonadota bacterium]|nr:type III-A CRISPR-associated RAMP protein Csm3 [Armatimonadota bacterium]